MTSSPASSLANLLGRFAAFEAIGSDRLAWLAERAQPFHCGVGQELLLPDRLPDYCYAVVEGRGRVLHQDPGLRRPVTLAYAQPGDLVGWAGLARRSPCEWITGVTPLKLIGIPAADFLQLECDSEPFRHWLDRNNSPAELMAALAPALRRRPKAEPPERDVLRRLLPHLQLIPARQERR
ncbi:MAG: cyclic nucleotide-binding domain-containing protein, partial [Cyanobacteria bacterium K_DeepCast_35m_m1_288]|nr:cyclic nucleotide-binding domain-containing protein [Cyanobacteria bacterium K_DeepCast_35m_m1_288]